MSDVFVRATKPNQQLQGVVINSYYSRYSRGFRNYLLTPYSWNLFCKVKDTDQRYEATIRDHYDIAPGLVSKNYPLMKDTAIYFINADANSPEGQVAIARGKNRYRVYTRTGGICLYTLQTILLRLYRLLVLSPQCHLFITMIVITLVSSLAISSLFL